jgi:hypothetical protein
LKIVAYEQRIAPRIGTGVDTGRGVTTGGGPNTGGGVRTGGDPRVPGGIANGGRPPQAVPQRLVGYGGEAFEELGAGARQLAFSMQAKQEEEGRAWAASAISEARLKWTQEMVTRQEQADPSATGFTPKFIEDFDSYSAEAVGNAPTEAAKRFLGERLGDLRATLGAHAMQFEAQARIDYRTDQFNSGIQNTARLMNTDPNQYQTALGEQLGIIESSALPPVKKSEMRDRAINAISGAAVMSQIQKSPEQFLQMIGFRDPESPLHKARLSSGEVKGETGFQPFDVLPFDKRMAFVEQALRLKAQIDADADRAAVAAQKNMREAAVKEGWSRFYNKNLTLDYIEQVRPVLDPQEYKAFRDALANPGQKDEPSTFRDLETLMAAQRYGAARAFAFKSHEAGLLSNSTLSSVVNRIVEAQKAADGKENGPKSPFERGMAYVVRSMDPGPLVPDPVGRSRMAEAIRDYENWYKSGPHTDEQIQEYTEKLVPRYKLIDFKDTVLQLPQPLYGTIRRNAQDTVGMEADLVAAGKATQKAKDEGKLTPNQYDQEMKRLARWRDAMKKAQ